MFKPRIHSETDRIRIVTLKESGKIWKEVIADAKRLYGITITKSGGQKNHEEI